MSDTLRVGFIGLGDQGAPMATAIAEKFELHFWAKRAASYDALGNTLDVKEADAVELTAKVDVLCLCLRPWTVFGLHFADAVGVQTAALRSNAVSASGRHQYEQEYLARVFCS